MENQKITVSAYFVTRFLCDSNNSGQDRTNFYDALKDVKDQNELYAKKKSWDYYNRVAVWYPGINKPVLFSIPAAQKLKHKAANCFNEFTWEQCKQIALMLE